MEFERFGHRLVADATQRAPLREVEGDLSLKIPSFRATCCKATFSRAGRECWRRAYSSLTYDMSGWPKETTN